MKTGSEMPPLNKGKLRLYSMVLCPYSIRTRLVLEAKKIPYETVNIDLNKKPEWYLKLNPAGQVPCLQFDDGRTIPESLITSEYLDQSYPQNKLIPADPYEQAQHKLIVERYSKIITNHYKVVRGSDQETINEYIASFADFESKLPEKGFLGGESPAFVDYMAWPWLERLEVVEKIRGFKVDKYPKLLAYIERMKNVPAVKEIFIKPEIHIEFYKGLLTGNPDYDIGLKQ